MSFAPRSMKRRNVKGLAINPEQGQAPPSLGGVQASGQQPYHNHSEHDAQDDTLEIGVEFRLDLHAEDLIVLKELGAGNGGSVSKVQHAATKNIMARKIIHVEAKKEIRKRIVRELGIMHECNSPYIVSFYGAFMNTSGDVVMCMEYMDVGSLDAISKNFGPVRIDVLGKIAEAVLGGLTYLYSAHRIMHRDIKPSNILVNSKGMIKLCDFGVSSELENSVADTFVGTGTYMAPERIQGSPYTVKSDVWSVGLTLMELAIGKFPFGGGDNDDEDDEDGGGPQGILDLLQQIVMEPSPKLPLSDAFPQILDDMLEKCLMKAPEQRPTPKELFEQDAFVQAAKRTPVDLVDWATSLLDRHNRKSHLPAQSQQYISASNTSSTTGTPTSADIPIQNLSLTDRDGDRNTYSRNGNSYADPYSQQTQPHYTSQTQSQYSTQPQPQSSSASSGPTSIRPGFPARLTSNSRVPQAQDNPTSGRYNHPAPLRMAPPSGPLPMPSGSSRRPPTQPSTPADEQKGRFNGY